MGVKDMWSILSPTAERKSLYELQGKAIAVDLSCWVVEDQTVAVHSTQPRMYLRNLFFRTSCLLLLGVRPVFVLEGTAPVLKHDTMARRNQTQFRSQGRSQASSQTSSQAEQPGRKKGNRSRLRSLLKMCEDMLRMMGAACVQSSGEAEALCAQLNALGMVDGCITQDGDCFLYGAETVYRNFTISASGSSSSSGYSVDVYTMANIEAKLRLSRERLVALSLLCGCDYGPGVNGVGKQMAVAWLDGLPGVQALQRLQRWRTDPYFDRLEREREVLTTAGVCDRCCHAGRRAKHEANGCSDCGTRTDCADNLLHRVLTDKQPDERKTMIAELNLRKKALADPGFPSQEMIDEFMQQRPEPPSLNLEWSEPNLAEFVRFAYKLLTWTETYAVEKFLPLVTRWQLTHLQRGGRQHDEATRFALSPEGIVKKRVQKGVACYEMRWLDNRGLLDTLDLDEGVAPRDLLISVEPQSLVDKVCPALVRAFVAEKEASKKGKRAPRKAKVAASVEPLKQTSLNRFLQPSQEGSSDDVVAGLSQLRVGARGGTQAGHVPQGRRRAGGSPKRKVAAKKKPQVTISSLLRAMGANQPGGAEANQPGGAEANEPRAVNRSSKLRTDENKRPAAGKRFASPRLKVGLKTRRLSAFNSTPKRLTPGRPTPERPTPDVCFSALEDSFRNISLVDNFDDDDDDDGDFSDLSAIIDGIVGRGRVTNAGDVFRISNERLSASKRTAAKDRPLAGRRSKESSACDDGNGFPSSGDCYGNFELGLSGLLGEVVGGGDESDGKEGAADSDSESDEFDFCNRKIVPLIDRLTALS